MGTKANPGKYDCYTAALDDEPQFTLNARDPDFKECIEYWAMRRLRRIQAGQCPASDLAMVFEAEATAQEGANWRAANMGKWRAGYTPKPI